MIDFLYMPFSFPNKPTLFIKIIVVSVVFFFFNLFCYTTERKGRQMPTSLSIICRNENYANDLSFLTFSSLLSSFPDPPYACAWHLQNSKPKY